MDFAVQGKSIADYFDAVNKGQAQGLGSLPGFNPGMPFGDSVLGTINTQNALATMSGYGFNGYQSAPPGSFDKGLPAMGGDILTGPLGTMTFSDAFRGMSRGLGYGINTIGMAPMGMAPAGISPDVADHLGGGRSFGDTYGFGADSGVNSWGDALSYGSVADSFNDYGLTGVDGTFGGGFSGGALGGGVGGGGDGPGSGGGGASAGPGGGGGPMGGTGAGMGDSAQSDRGGDTDTSGTSW